MKLIDAIWAPFVNILGIRCDCGVEFAWPSNISVVHCSFCGRRELYHPVNEVSSDSIWNMPVMERAL